LDTTVIQRPLESDEKNVIPIDPVNCHLAAFVSATNAGQ
jgi:hypothetical protein